MTTKATRSSDEYKKEDSKRIDNSQAHEQQRPEAARSTNRYLKSVRYGNRTPNRDANWNATDPSQLPDNNWMFEVVFDYGESHYTEGGSECTRAHLCERSNRTSSGIILAAPPGSFSTYRAGFEVRTYRLCQRVLLFHHFTQRARH
jgi:hypothetical protein